jgi:hypothetical protein
LHLKLENNEENVTINIKLKKGKRISGFEDVTAGAGAWDTENCLINPLFCCRCNCVSVISNFNIGELCL